jgi:hypothetical protein
LAEGKKVLEGPRIYFWVLAIIAGIGVLSQNSLNMLSMSRDLNYGPVSIGLPGSNSIWIFAALYVVALVGFHMRKSWAVPVGRAGLVVSMVVLFPIGTIFGAILWKRINDPIAKMYLGHNTDEPPTAETATTATTAATTSATTEAAGEKITITAQEKPESKPE